MHISLSRDNPAKVRETDKYFFLWTSPRYAYLLFQLVHADSCRSIVGSPWIHASTHGAATKDKIVLN